MTVKTAIVFILSNRDMYGERVTSPNMIKYIEELTGEKLSDPQLRKIISEDLCMEDGLLIGGTRTGFIIAQSKEEAKEIYSNITDRIAKTVRHSRHFEQIATQKFHDFSQESLF